MAQKDNVARDKQKGELNINPCQPQKLSVIANSAKQYGKTSLQMLETCISKLADGKKQKYRHLKYQVLFQI